MALELPKSYTLNKTVIIQPQSVSRVGDMISVQHIKSVTAVTPLRLKEL